MLYGRTLFIHSIYNSLYFLISVSHSLPPPTCQHRATFTPEFQQNMEVKSTGSKSPAIFCYYSCPSIMCLFLLMPLLLCPSFLYFHLQHFHFTVACNQATLSILSASYQQFLQNPVLINTQLLLETPSLCLSSGGVLIHLLFIHLSAGAGMKIYIIYICVCIYMKIKIDIIFS